MAGTGPAPSPTSRRQAGNQAHTWTNLPADGYSGDIPEWPLAAFTPDELETWVRIWRTPQAAAWASLGWTHEVAIYVRILRLAESALVDLKAVTESRLRSQELGLTPTGMLKNRWRIASDEVAVKRTEKAAPKARRRLKVADDAVAGS